MAVSIPALGDARVYKYGYDQLNRLVTMDAYGGLNNSANTFSPVLLDDYQERITYDANGNILTYKRNGDAARLAMDNLTYTYKPGTNQLDKVVDTAPDAAAGEYDKYNDIRQGQQDDNYQYDAIGNLISDVSEGITNIEWSVYGKIRNITKNDGANISYIYDAAGNRISKNVNGEKTWYVRDASGNVMSIYEKDATENNGHLIQTEVHLYGSSRLGIFNVGKNMEAPPAEGNITTFTIGKKFFELTNHLGNVLATVSDRKTGVDTNGDGIIDYYTADIVSANDYYPFGMMMPSRKYSIANTNYRYGFNGKEKDNEVKGEGSFFDYGAREYDPRVGRFFTVDPKFSAYVSMSPYVYAANNPILLTDQNGEGPSLPPIYDPQGKFVLMMNSSLTLHMVFRSFSTAQNSSPSHLQKFLWAQPGSDYYNKSFNQIKGTVGEGLVLKDFMFGFNSVGVGTIMHNPFSKDSWRSGLKIGNVSYSLHPNQLTDIRMDVKANSKDKFVHQFLDYGGLLELLRDDYHYKSVTFIKNTSFVYEVKTNKSEGGDIYTEKNIQRGVDQLLSNPDVANNNMVPVLVLDKAYFDKAWKNNRSVLKSAIDQLAKYNGGIYIVEDLNKNATEAIKEMQQKVKSTDKPSANYYNYNTSEQ